MAKPYKIVEKAIKVIESCDNLKYIQIMDNYIDLAVKQILKRKTAKNYQYADKIQIAGHYKAMNLIKQGEIENLFNFERRY